MPRLSPKQFHFVFEPIQPQGSYRHHPISSPYYLWFLLFGATLGFPVKELGGFSINSGIPGKPFLFIRTRSRSTMRYHLMDMSCQTILLYLREAFPDPPKKTWSLLPPLPDLESSTDSFAWRRIIRLLVSHSVTPLKGRNIVLLFVSLALAFNPVPDTWKAFIPQLDEWVFMLIIHYEKFSCQVLLSQFFSQSNNKEIIISIFPTFHLKF